MALRCKQRLKKRRTFRFDRSALGHSTRCHGVVAGVKRRHDQPSGDYETCQHPVAKNRETSHHVAAVSRPCRERV
eukprot:5836694-Prymnesium_polylepis.1